ncbi:Rrf2 family transcriptional regulator [Acidovorax sp.]|uniref:Rrf2 family transcriptional regulator n=1 Tax=Acidovorax sp. TaxID=1872122 RepID=UPI002ACD299D|nr:Rrf2 family transcriptional regulator [Acidovorax sp.]MDZ7867293.1 Rrf2 family transcriptional regulator [Acidovorax sp.]
MRLTTRSKFAVVAMVDLASRSVGSPVALSALSERYEISVSYLEVLFSGLRQAGLVTSTRGPGGGYTLARGARDISVADIVLASEVGKPGGAGRLGDAMSTSQGAMTADLWAAFNHSVMEYLASVSVAELVSQQAPIERAPPMAAEKDSPAKRAKPRPQLPREGVPNSVFALGASRALEQ